MNKHRNYTLVCLSFLLLAYLVVDTIYHLQNGIHATWHELMILPNLHGFENSVWEVIPTGWYVILAIYIVLWVLLLVSYFLTTARVRLWVNRIFYIALTLGVAGSLIREIPRKLTSHEREILSAINPPVVSRVAQEGHTVVLLGESWETWGLMATDTLGNPVCPHIRRYIDTHPSLYVRHLIPQKRHGVSGDGQLIVFSGLMPLTDGVASMTYGDDVRPNFAGLYEHATAINYNSPFWNWTTTAHHYGFGHYSVVDGQLLDCTDSVLLSRLRQEIEHDTLPTCYAVYTISTHDPFNHVPVVPHLADTYSDREKRYLNTCAYSDQMIGRFLAWADTAECMQGARIIFASDHHIFRPDEQGHGTCIFWMTSPNIVESCVIDTAYHMDVFTTISADMGRVGGWRGFGINLLDTTDHRAITPHEAQRLSDKLIRMHYSDYNL